MAEQNAYTPNSNIYKYKASIEFLLGEDVYYIKTLNIKSIAIDSNYKENNMPMLFVTASVDKRLYDKMIQNQDTGSIVLTIQRCIANSDMPDLYTDYIKDKFIYFLSDDINKNDLADYEGENDGREDIFKLVSFGLMSLDHINKNKKVVNGIFDGKLSSLMYYLTNHLDILIEPPKDNKDLKNIFIPPTNSVSKSLEYLNSLNVFYASNYRFFMDFDCAYLLSSDGKAVKKVDEDISTVFLVLKNSYDEGSKIQGMIIDETQSMYQIECDAQDCELSDTHISEKLYSKLVATDTSGKQDEFEITTTGEDSLIEEKTKAVRVMNQNSGIIDNIVSSVDRSAITLMVQKTDIDSAVLTMNKEYIVKADETYGTEDYNGRYIVTRKRELYIREDENFVMNTMLILEKIPGETYVGMPKVISAY